MDFFIYIVTYIQIVQYGLKKESSKTVETLEFPNVEKKKTEKENSIDKKPCVKKNSLS